MKSRMAYSPIAITHRITMDISTHVSLNNLAGIRIECDIDTIE